MYFHTGHLYFHAQYLRFEEALDYLVESALIRRTTGSNLSVHRLIQYEFRQHMKTDGRRKFFQLAFQLLYEAFPKQVNGASLRNEEQQCKLHIDHVLQLCVQWQSYQLRPERPGEYMYFTKLLTNAGW